MSEREEHDFVKDYLVWMKGPGASLESIHAYNFGYQRPLPFPSIAMRPNSPMRLNLQTSGMQTPSRKSIVFIGKKYIRQLEDVLSTF